MDRGAWWAAVHGVAEGWTRLNSSKHTKQHLESLLQVQMAHQHPFLLSVHKQAIEAETQMSPTPRSPLLEKAKGFHTQG